MSQTVFAAAHALYDRTLRPAQKHLGLRKPNYYNDVAVPEQARFTDRTHHCEHKPEAIDAIEEYVESGDHVIEIGAGRGVFATVAARQGATITGYEANASHSRLARLTAKANGVADQVKVEHAVVGDPIHTYGPVGAAKHVDPSNGSFPDCDVLLMDCEGAELGIIESMAQRPERVIVETHPTYDAPTDAVKSALVRRGYEILHSAEIVYGAILVAGLMEGDA